MMHCADLTFSIGGKAILNGINAEIPEGGLTALVGPNGAGKSTLMALMGRLSTPDSGRITLNGQDIATLHRAEFARQVSTLRQSTRITPRLSVHDLVCFGRYPHTPGALTPADHAIVDACLEDLALTDLAGRHLDTLSGGQLQRALIAMVLAQDTRIILLDEPLNNLDLTFARRVMTLLTKLGQSGRTVVTVLHDLTIAARFADHVIAMKSGQVMMQDTPQQVFSATHLKDLYDTEVEVHLINGKPVVLPI